MEPYFEDMTDNKDYTEGFDIHPQDIIFDSNTFDNLTMSDDTSDEAYAKYLLEDTAFVEFGYFIEKVGELNLFIEYDDAHGSHTIEAQIPNVAKNEEAISAFLEIIKRKNMVFTNVLHFAEVVFRIERYELSNGYAELELRSLIGSELDEIKVKL